ncbi:MAPEG family protein [Lyngbya sp. CCAP 1446/10]|uniref:MAPEG family protein n=1 Tax=Lyngbya sp. CCAP 1446/10 TaxID=439293 RepID=UPI0022374C3D|nr:MAPEG family protein [Lyngbya sp. CCAP 1446/10]MCW6052432.1 MAPEG family protein [Lyngbya sp. CCAP 1446/10]
MLLGLPVSVILLDCIAAAAALVYAPFLVVALARLQLGYDQAAPRAMFESLPAYAQRATWAHQNSFETFMLFSAAALMAFVTGVDSEAAGWAAIAFPLARLLFSVFYILNVPLGRSLMFAISSSCAVSLFYISLMAVNG